MAVAILVGSLRSAVRDPLLDNGLSLATPFAAYLLGRGGARLRRAGGGGGRAVDRPPQLPMQSGRARLQARAVWRLVEFLLQGYVFVLIGQQLPAVVRGLGLLGEHDRHGGRRVSLGVVLLVRPLWLYATAHLPGRMHARLGGDPGEGDQPLSGREVSC